MKRPPGILALSDWELDEMLLLRRRGWTNFEQSGLIAHGGRLRAAVGFSELLRGIQHERRQTRERV